MRVNKNRKFQRGGGSSQTPLEWKFRMDGGLKTKNRSAMRTWGLMLDFILFGWNAVLKYQHLGVDLLQVKR